MVCGAGAGKISQTPAGVGSNFAGADTISTRAGLYHISFNPRRTTTFPTVDSSATALAAACLLLTCLPQLYLVAASTAISE